MLSAALSFTDPPGLNHSALAQNSIFGNFRPMRSSRNKGVFPMRSSTDCPADEPRSRDCPRSVVAIAIRTLLPNCWTHYSSNRIEEEHSFTLLLVRCASLTCRYTHGDRLR